MQWIGQGYRWLLNGLAVLAGLVLVWLMLAVIVSVLMRNAGVQPWSWLFVSTEYGLYLMTLLGAPWLVRERGHVHIELFTAALSPAALQVVSRLVSLVCVVACLVLAWKGVDLVERNLLRNDFDVRGGYFVPRWWLTVVIPVAFGLMAIEFGRYVIGRELWHSGEAGIRE